MDLWILSNPGDKVQILVDSTGQQTWTFFFVNSEILGIYIWRTKRVNYDKFKIATNCVNQIFYLNAFFFFLLTGATWYLRILHHLQSMNMAFLKLFLIGMLKDLNLAEKFRNFGRKSFKKLSSTEFRKFVFFQVCGTDLSHSSLFFLDLVPWIWE